MRPWLLVLCAGAISSGPACDAAPWGDAPAHAQPADATDSDTAPPSEPVIDPGAAQPQAVERAIAVLQPTAGHTVSGTVRFEAVRRGLRVKGQVQGLPLGRHVYRVHMLGDCSGADAATAGAPFNFRGSSREPGRGARRSLGRLGELITGLETVATAEAVLPHATLHGAFSIVGRSVVVHAGDDVQPGIAGNRLACGVIGIDEG